MLLSSLPAEKRKLINGESLYKAESGVPGDEGWGRVQQVILPLPAPSFARLPGLHLAVLTPFLLLLDSPPPKTEDGGVSHGLWASFSCWHSFILRYQSAARMSTQIFPAQIAGLPCWYAQSSLLSISSWMCPRHLIVSTCQARTSVLRLCASAVHGAVFHFAYAKDIFLA